MPPAEAARLSDLAMPKNGHSARHLSRICESSGSRSHARRLNFPARSVLDFLELEHLRNAGFENGYLAAPYRQIQATGMSKRDVPKAIQMLKAFGFIARTDVNMRLAGRKNIARYRLTYLPDRSGNMPTDEWRNIERKHLEAFKADSKLHPD
jgi:hypothetical protein